MSTRLIALTGLAVIVFLVQGTGASSPPALAGGPQSPPPQCSDGDDNDGDGLVDYGWDPGCFQANDNDEYNAPLPPPPLPPPPPPPPPQGPVQIVSNTSDLVKFRNNDGDWTFWKVCSSIGGGSLTIGPGYIGGGTTPQGVTMFDDWAGEPDGVNGFRGGLGTFGVHYARGGPTRDRLEPLAPPYLADLTGRDCYPSNSGEGVYQVDITRGPETNGTVGYFNVDVWIRDYWGNTGFGPNGHAGLKLSYENRIEASVIKEWVTVTSYFSPNADGIPFVKEPKFTGSLPNSTAGYKRIAIFGGSAGTTFLKAIQGSHPKGSEHSGDDQRLRVRYDFATSTAENADPHCQGTISPCLNVLFRATPAGGGWAFWENQGAGLDKWATDAVGTTRFNTEDRINLLKVHGDPNPWNCHATPDITPEFASPEESTAYRGSPGDINSPGGVRRWEFGTTVPSNPPPPPAPPPPFTNAMFLANGWEGGRGSRDCESTSMQFPAPGTSYKIEMDVSVDSGW